MEAEYTIRAYEKNQISLYAVLGEENSRTFIFNIIEKSGTISATSNAIPVNQMLDLTDYSVKFRLIGSDIQTDGNIITADEGKVSFTLPKSFTESTGTFQCEIMLSKENESLGIIGIILNVAYPSVQTKKENIEEYEANQSIAFTIPKGTPYILKFDLRNYPKWIEATRRKSFYTAKFQIHDKLLFGIKKHPADTEYVFQKTAERDRTYNTETHEYEDTGGLDEYGRFSVELTEEDTDIEPGIYYYSIAANIRNTENTKTNFVEIVPPTAFKIRKMMIQEGDL